MSRIWVDFDVAVDEETLSVMKRRVAQMALEAEAAGEAYRKALEVHWRQWVADKVGQTPFEWAPVECVLTDRDGTRVVLAFKVDVSDGNLARLHFRERIKSGRWGKSVYQHFLPCNLQKC